jgi:hypothetical protein
MFTEMDEYHDMRDGIWVEVVDLKNAEVKKALKEIRGREGQSPFNKMLK